MKIIATLFLSLNLLFNFTNVKPSNYSNVSSILNSIKNFFTKEDNGLNNKIIVLNEDKPNKMKIDDLAVISLETDPSQGYRWHFSCSNPEVLDLIFKNRIKDNETFIFKSLLEGICEIKFEYYKDDEKESPNAKILNYKIIVK